MTTEYPENTTNDLEKFKHELLGSLGVIKMLTSSLIHGSMDPKKTRSLLRLINDLAERNIQVVTNFNGTVPREKDIRRKI